MKHIIIVLIFFVLPIGICTTRYVKSVQFTQDCGGYLKRAADANTVEIAESELDKAVEYLEKNNITTGYTSVIYNTPDEDIYFWYSNLTESLTELKKIDKNASNIEKTNVLMKLRETLMDNGKKGSSITMPQAIHLYPNNGIWLFLTNLSWVLIIVGLGFYAIWLDS